MEVINNAFKVFLILVLTIFAFSNVEGQDCISYPDIEGAPCKDCAPPGWTPTNMFQKYIHIIPPSNGMVPNTSCSVANISGPSPSGGNVVLISDNTMTIETSLSGLDTDLTYVFGMYWEQININCVNNNYFGGPLIIIIDGQSYSFSSANEWELAEVCFKPSSSSVEVIITTSNNGGIIIDGNPACFDLTPCCTLTLDIENDNFSVCPDETIVLDAAYEDEIGTVRVEWSCDPSSGLDFLSATNVISPEFTFPTPPADFFGETYKFLLTVEDDRCVQTIECIEVEVRPSVLPEFDIDLCNLDITAQLPSVSLNGYTGEWDGDFFIEFQGGSTVPFLFTLHSGQNNCIESHIYELYVANTVITTFDIEEVYCVSDSNNYTLPTESVENIQGQWLPSNVLNPSALGLGAFSYTFVPDDNLYCESDYELKINIVDSTSVSFDLPEVLCLDSSHLVLPLTTMEGDSGTWTIDSIDLSTVIHDSVIVFTLNQGNNCTVDFNYNFSVLEYSTPLFSIEESYCSNDNPFTLPDISLDSIQGVWNVNQVDPSLQDTLDIIYTVDSVGCFNVYRQTLYFREFLDPIFSIPEMMCKDGGAFIFPTISDNGISGTWLAPSFTPSAIIQNSYTNTFTPDDTLCTSQYSISIDLLSFENILLVLSDPSSCESEDGSIQITGASLGMQLSTDNAATWAPVNDIENLSSGLYHVQLRYQALPTCIAVYTPQLNNLESPIIQEVIFTNPSACGQENGSIQCNADGSNLEYSLDSVNWQTSNIFENLGQGNYLIYVRVASQNDCVSSVFASLEDPVAVEICDGIDNNCNGEIDENLPAQYYYADKDMDGFGDPLDSIYDCQQPLGYLLDNTDCDDTNPNINPNADEIPNNDFDENCDGIAEIIDSVHDLEGLEINIYPNPTLGLVTIEMKESIDLRYALYDLNGKCLFEKDQVKILDLRGYPNGVYLLTISNEKSMKSIVERIVLID